jgi:pimeloyl-ACP methyl ester carboxylesterase
MNETTQGLLGACLVGHHEFHPDANINFEMNRWLAWAKDPSMVGELEEVAPRIATHADFIREFKALAERAERGGAPVKAAYYWRGAEFFMDAADPERKPLRERFIRVMRELYGIGDRRIERVPYSENGRLAYLPAIEFGEAGHGDPILMHGGFDSYFEETIPMASAIASAGHRVVLFEGPGQGGVLEAGMPMSYRWELPVAAVLDHFRLGEVGMVGLSLGGYLALRAAAFEPRVRRVVAWDVIYDTLDTFLSQLPVAATALVRAALALRADPLLDAFIRWRMGRDLVVEWGVKQGMRVFGSPRPSGFLRAARRCAASSFSGKVEGDVLLLAGAEDHFVPLEMLYLQHRALTKARSVTTRIFTKADSAQGHCQVGNLGLALRVILDWLESVEASATPSMRRWPEGSPR